MAMTLITTTTIGSGGAAAIEFTNLAQTGKDILVLFSGRSAGNNQNRALSIQINSNTSDIYTTLRLEGNGGAVNSNRIAPGSGIPQILLNSGNQGTQTTANTFSNVAIYFPNYTSNVAKSVYADAVTENNATEAYQSIYAGRAATTAAITSIKLYDDGSTFSQNTTASLYIIS